MSNSLPTWTCFIVGKYRIVQNHSRLLFFWSIYFIWHLHQDTLKIDTKKTLLSWHIIFDKKLLRNINKFFKPLKRMFFSNRKKWFNHGNTFLNVLIYCKLIAFRVVVFFDIQMGFVHLFTKKLCIQKIFRFWNEIISLYNCWLLTRIPYCLLSNTKLGLMKWNSFYRITIKLL